MKKIFAIFIVLILLCSISVFAFADYFPSPVVTTENILSRFGVTIITDLYHIYDKNTGELLRFIQKDNVKIEFKDNYFIITINPELKDNEYLELIISNTNDNFKVFDNFNNELIVEHIDNYYIIHIEHSCLITFI